MDVSSITMLTERELSRDEINLVWTIDRREVIEGIYYLVGSALELRAEYYDMPGWPDGEQEKYGPILSDIFDRGGWFYGVFDSKRLVAVAVLDSRFVGPHSEHCVLDFLHVSRDYRGQGLGRKLLVTSQEKARLLGAKWLYISATPSQRTVEFYLNQGCRVVSVPVPHLLALEPNDIHMECRLLT